MPCLGIQEANGNPLVFLSSGKHGALRPQTHGPNVLGARICRDETSAAKKYFDFEQSVIRCTEMVVLFNL
jgi:hypothetical protein